MLDLVRWDPFRELAAMRQGLARFTPEMGGVTGAPWTPVSDTIETADGYLITAELPGVKDEDIEITVRGGVLTISGTRELQDEVSDEHFHRLERAYGAFERSFRLPEGVARDDIHASVAYGVLRVTVPKAAETEARRVPVQGTG